MSFVSNENEGVYRSSLNEVTEMLKNKHGENYMVCFKPFILLNIYTY